MFGKKGSMLTCDNTIWCIKIKGQKKPRETFKETSRSLIQEWVDKWPSSMLTRWRRWWWCGCTDGVWHPARNCAYLTFQYKFAKYLLHIPLYPTTAIISQSKAYATSIPKSKAMKYFKSTHHVCIVCAFISQCNICELVPTPEIHLQIHGNPNNAWEN